MSEDLQRLVDEQARVMGVQSMPVKTENKGSAATDRVNIFVNPSFASSVMSSAGSNGMRFVLAHELAHARAGCPGGHSGELAADRWATRSLVRAGIDMEPVDKVMAMLHGPATKSHPGSTERAENARSEWQARAGVRRPRKPARESLQAPPRTTKKHVKVHPNKFRER